MIQFKKILMTLALLITAVTGAWADGIVCTASDLGKVLCTDGSIYENVTAATTANKTAAAVIAYVDETNKNGLAIALADEGTMNWSTAKSTCEGKTAITGVKWCLPSQDQWKQMFKANGGNEDSYTGLNTTINTAGGTTLPEASYWSSSESDPGVKAWNVALFEGSAIWGGGSEGIGKQVRACLAFAITDPNAIDVKWDAKAQTGTFVMPTFDVEIDPIYAPVAQWAKVENVDQLPTAIEGIYAESTDAIVKAGTVAKIGETENAQGTLMYLVTTENKKPASTTGFSATVPTGAALTGSFAEDQTVYVWYYIKGIDAAEGVTPTAENTFNDSEICTTPLTITLKANQFDLTLSPAPVKNMTVTVAGQAATPDQEGKVEAVKMQSEVKLKANTGYKFRKVEVKKGAPDVKIESFSIHTSSNDVYSAGTFTCSIIDILPANATNQTFEWKINSGAPAGTTIKTVSDDTKTVTIQAGAVSGSITIEATAKDGGGANKSKDIMVKE